MYVVSSLYCAIRYLFVLLPHDYKSAIQASTVLIDSLLNYKVWENLDLGYECSQEKGYTVTYCTEKQRQLSFKGFACLLGKSFSNYFNLYSLTFSIIRIIQLLQSSIVRIKRSGVPNNIHLIELHWNQNYFIYNIPDLLFLTLNHLFQVLRK